MISIPLILNWPDEREAARLSFAARIVSLMRGVRDMRDKRDGPNGAGLMDSKLRASLVSLMRLAS